MNGSFSRDPKTEKDAFKYERISDVFGLKVVASEHYDPPSSIFSTTNELIAKKQAYIKSIRPFHNFGDKLTAYKTGISRDEPITFRELYETYEKLLDQYIKVVGTEKHSKLLDYLKNKKTSISKAKVSYTQLFDLDSPIDEHINIMNELYDDFMYFLNRYKSYICTPLTINGIQQKLKATFFNDLTGIQKSINALGVQIYSNYEIKSAESGRRAIHVDGHANFCKCDSQFEMQFLSFTQFIKDIERKFKCTCYNAW